MKIIWLATLTIGLCCLNAPDAMPQAPSTRFGFTIIPMHDPGNAHGPGSLTYQAAIVDARGRLTRLTFRDSRLKGGTSFVAWVRNGDSIIQGFESPTQYQSFLIDKTRRVKLCITCNSSSTANEQARPIYKTANSRNPYGYIFLSDLPQHRTCHVDAKGEHISCIPTAGVHGCSLSSDNKHATCEDDTKQALLLYDVKSLDPLDFEHPLTIGRRDDEQIPLHYAHWAPNGRGFVYTSWFSDHQFRYVYYDLSSKHYSVLNTPDWIAGFACETGDPRYDYNKGPYYVPGKEICGNIGTCDDLRTCNEGTEPPGWSPDSNSVCFSALDWNLSSSGPPWVRVVGQVSTSLPGYFKPISHGKFGKGARNCSFVDNHNLIVMSVTSNTDARSQLYLLNERTGHMSLLTKDLKPSEEVYFPVVFPGGLLLNAGTGNR